MELAIKIPSVVQKPEIPAFREKGVELLVKREDLLHPEISGNKWRKLKYNLTRARQEDKTHLLTFGGTYSNHLYAVAAAGKAFGFSTIGLVRGEPTVTLNPTLQFAKDCGMRLEFLSRTDYRQKEKMLAPMGLDGPEVYVIPEGGTNLLAIQGCIELAQEIEQQIPNRPDYLCLSCGTGGTMAGLIAGLKDQSRVLGFSALKGDFHATEIQTILENYRQEYPEQLTGLPRNWTVNTGYHFGGYARFQPELIDFINGFKSRYAIPLDPIYTGKLFYGLFDLVEKDYFAPGSTVLAIHTGGLQGITGFNQRFGPLIK